MHCSLSIYRSDVCRIPQTNDVQLFEAAVKVIFPTIAIFALFDAFSPSPLSDIPGSGRRLQE
jgi:hypothetical protein